MCRFEVSSRLPLRAECQACAAARSVERKQGPSQRLPLHEGVAAAAPATDSHHAVCEVLVESSLFLGRLPPRTPHNRHRFRKDRSARG